MLKKLKPQGPLKLCRDNQNVSYFQWGRFGLHSKQLVVRSGSVQVPKRAGFRSYSTPSALNRSRSSGVISGPNTPSLFNLSNVLIVVLPRQLLTALKEGIRDGLLYKIPGLLLPLAALCLQAQALLERHLPNVRNVILASIAVELTLVSFT